MFSVTFFDTGNLSQPDRDAAEDAYRSAILAEVPNIEILKLIYQDDLDGVDAGLDRFELTSSAWAELDRIGQRAAQKSIGFWPKDSAHFEVSF